jgi:hypothetical protein
MKKSHAYDHSIMSRFNIEVFDNPEVATHVLKFIKSIEKLPGVEADVLNNLLVFTETCETCQEELVAYRKTEAWVAGRFK